MLRPAIIAVTTSAGQEVGTRHDRLGHAKSDCRPHRSRFAYSRFFPHFQWGFQDKPFAAMFSRSCGGRTLTPSDVGLPGSEYPYFSVLCDFCYRNPSRWARKLSPKDAALLAKGESGRLAVDRRLGWNAVPSNNFTSREEDGQVILEGAGQGHGIGLCQRGAKAMAGTGSGFRQILDHYFPNTALLPLGEHIASDTRSEEPLPPYSLSLIWDGREFRFLTTE